MTERNRTEGIANKSYVLAEIVRTFPAFFWHALVCSILLSGALASMPATAQPVPGSTGCQLVVEAKLPLIVSDSRYLAPVDIAGRPYLINIDTGAESTALTPQAADDLQLPQDGSHTVRVTGAGEKVDAQYPRFVPSIKLGPAEWVNLSVPISNMLSTKQQAEKQVPIGILGANLLSRYDVELDFPGKTMTLYSASNCLGRFAPWSGHYQAFSPEFTPGHRFILNLTLNGHPIRAIIDSGASRSLLTREAAQAAGVDGAMLERDPKSAGSGVAGAQFAIYRHTFDSLAVGSSTFKNVNIEVTDNTLKSTDMLLGMDFLKWRKVWLSYSTGWVFMQLAQPAMDAQTTVEVPRRVGKASLPDDNPSR